MRSLAMLALGIVRRAGPRGRRPDDWMRPGFAREVELIRLHLAPIRSRAVLAASFGREAFHGTTPDGIAPESRPVAIAYAIRWLELADGEARPRWELWLAEARPAPS